MSTPLERKPAPASPDPLLLAAFNATADAFVVVDSAQCVQHINLAASALLGYSTSEAIGRHWQDVVQFVEGGPGAIDAGHDCAALSMESDHATLCLRNGSLKAVAARLEAMEAGAFVCRIARARPLQVDLGCANNKCNAPGGRWRNRP